MEGACRLVQTHGQAVPYTACHKPLTGRAHVPCLNRTGWYEFTHTASAFNITSTDKQLGNFTGSVDSAYHAFEATKGSLIRGGNPSLKVQCCAACLAVSSMCQCGRVLQASHPLLSTGNVPVTCAEGECRQAGGGSL